MTYPATLAKEIVRLDDPASGLDGFIVIHSTVRGVGAGGCRLRRYDDREALYLDAARLAEGMALKNALAELPFGGAKAVLNLPDEPFDRRALFRAFGRAVADLGGRYVTAEDVGTTMADMECVRTETRHVAGLRQLGDVAGGDPGPWTALGVFAAIEAAARVTLDRPLSALRVAVQGTGSVGAALCGLLADAGARLTIADADAARADAVAARHDARIVDGDAILTADVDILAPCALGGVLTGQGVPAIRAALICGAANNQLATPQVAAMLHGRGIVYVPDYAANAGGVISGTAEYLGESAAATQARIRDIGPRVAAILDAARRDGLPPVIIAEQWAATRYRRQAA